MRRLSPTNIALILGGLLLLIVIGVLIARGSGGNQDKLSDEAVGAANGAGDSDKACAAQATYDEIKRELFRQAAATRGRDAATYDRLAAYANLAVDRPRLVGEEAEIGGLRCQGELTLSVPPNVEAVGGRRSFTAEATWLVQPAADGSGPAVTLTGVEGITIPLATLTKSGTAPPPATQPAPVPIPTIDPLAPQPAAPTAPPSVQPTTSPSFDCRAARTRGEIAVCSSGSLAALDRDMAAHYVRALRQATPEQRRLIQGTRDRFLAYRDRCPTDACIADAYRGRITEISDILADRWRAPR